jgi:hypothetical protein
MTATSYPNVDPPAEISMEPRARREAWQAMPIG